MAHLFCMVSGIELGVTGAACGRLAVHMAGAAGRWMASLVQHSRRRHQSNSTWVTGTDSVTQLARRVLAQFTGTEDRGWEIGAIGGGCQATVVLLTSTVVQPNIQLSHELAVKLYKPRSANIDFIQHQSACMSQLHARLDGKTINGWRICIPEPLCYCTHPPALITTIVTGVSLNIFMATAATVSHDTIGDIADSIIAAMLFYWRMESQPHGDFNFDNILCDIDGKTLSLIDPGIFDNYYFCKDVPMQWYPASRDLAWMLYETAMTAEKSFSARTRRRQHAMVECILRSFITRLPVASEQHSLLDETETCARWLLDRLNPSWSPRGLWVALLKQNASRRIDSMCRRLRGELETFGEAPGGSG